VNASDRQPEPYDNGGLLPHGPARVPLAAGEVVLSRDQIRQAHEYMMRNYGGSVPDPDAHWYGAGGWIPAGTDEDYPAPGEPGRVMDASAAEHFYEDDEDPASVFAAFDAADKGTTAPPDETEPAGYICSRCQSGHHERCDTIDCTCCSGGDDDR
jgi:hypothetical protein